jgi:predicted outer membrane lipoprotein
VTNQNTTITLNPKRILIALLILVVIIVGLSIYGQKVRFFGVADIRGPWHEFVLDQLMQNFYLDAEGNITTYINALLLFIPSLLLAAIGIWKSSIKDKFRFHWIGLAMIFFFLSIDEAAVIHENMIKPMRAIVGSNGVFYFAWIIPGMAIVAAFGLVYLMFFLHLENKFKILFLFSLGVYISGVIGGEMISGYYASNIGQKNFTYAVVASLEESIEYIGCSLIIYSLLKYIEHYLPEGITFKAS